jgi:hypothetical protein
MPNFPVATANMNRIMGPPSLTSIMLPPHPTGAHLGTSDAAPHSFQEHLVDPASVTPNLRDPFNDAVVGGPFYAKLYELVGANPRYYGVGFRYGITDIGTVNIFFHPSPAVAGLQPGDYVGLGGSWTNLYRYIQNFSVQLAAASANIVLVMPMVNAGSWPDSGVLRGSWRDIVNAILVEVQKVAWPDNPGSVMPRNQTALQNIIFSGFSAGRIAMSMARQFSGIDSALREVWDFDGAQVPVPTAPAGGQALLYDQALAQGDATHFHAPPARWSSFPFFAPKVDVHGHIPQRLAYHAATRSAFGH